MRRLGNGRLRSLPAGAVGLLVLVLVMLRDDLVGIGCWLTGTGDARESGSATIRNLGLVVAGIIALPLAVWRSVVASKQVEVARQGLLNERYQKGAEMLGDENLSVRLGGVYALQALIEEHPGQYYISCMRLLCAFTRNPTVDERLIGFPEEERPGILRPRLREDVQAIMDMMRSRDDRLIDLEKEREFEVDFRGADLREANLRSVNFTGVYLRGANLSGAYAVSSNLSHAGLSEVNLSGARLALADFSGSDLADTDVSGTWFCDTSISGGFSAPAIGLTSSRFARARAGLS